MKREKCLGAILAIILVLVFDQWLKIEVKTHMLLGESITVTSWFKIYFTENPGMAFGIEIIGKLFLSLSRIVAVAFMGYYLFKILKKNYKFGYIACISLIIAGAIGNILDSVFYGVIFNDSPFWPMNVGKPVSEELLSQLPQASVLFPPEGGYGTWLHGRVVDMLYFPLIDTVLPEWFPIWGGEQFIFFRPIFNLADSSICIGVFLLFIFYRRTLTKSLSKEEKGKEEEDVQNAV